MENTFYTQKTTKIFASIDEWNRIADELSMLRRTFLADLYDRQMDENPEMEIPFTREELVKNKVINAT